LETLFFVGDKKQYGHIMSVTDSLDTGKIRSLTLFERR